MEQQTEIIAIKLIGKLVDIDLSNDKKYFITTDNLLYILKEYHKITIIIDAKSNTPFDFEALLLTKNNTVTQGVTA